MVLGVVTAVAIFGVASAWGHYIERASDEEFEVSGEDLSRTPPVSQELVESWQRPKGPLRVGLQVGHWKNSEAPDELHRLRERGGGTAGGGKAEWQVNLAIAQETAKLLEAKGIVVDLLPVTIPPDYLADLFISIHADGSTNSGVSGFKVASPWRDATGRGEELVDIFEKAYGNTTSLEIDPNVTRNMRGYYAFNWRRYEHSIHEMTPAIILETGFLTSRVDQKLLIRNPALAARGIAQGIFEFLGVE